MIKVILNSIYGVLKKIGLSFPNAIIVIIEI